MFDNKVLIDAGIIEPKQRRPIIKLQQQLDEEKPAGPAWPEPLPDDAFLGIAGETVKTIMPHSEADPVALLISYFVLYGNIIGRTAHFIAEADYHFLNLFTCLIGATAKGRKGVSFGQIKKIFEAVDPIWAKERITQGLSSGEGLIWACRDEQRTTKTNKAGEEEEIIIVDGIDDKRLSVVEAEFASTIRVLKREGNTLSAIIRKAWDDGDLNSLTKNNIARATGAHISLLAHITKDELLRFLDSIEMANGFGNRFLWVCVSRSKILPEGGFLNEVNFAPYIKDLKEAVHYGRATKEIKRDQKAREIWHSIYPELSEGRPGLLGAMLARSEAQVMRLACIYALVNFESRVGEKHLKAALSLWNYCEQSARFIFGDSIGDPIADEIIKALRDAGQAGMSRTDIINHFGRNKGAREISRALNLLAERGMARYQKTVNAKNRPVELWFKT